MAFAEMDIPEYENKSACKRAIQTELEAEANLANLETDLEKQNLTDVEAVALAKADLETKRQFANSTCGDSK